MIRKAMGLILVGCVLLGLFSCRNNEDPAPSDETSAPTTTGSDMPPSATPEDDPYLPTLEEGLDFQNSEIRILQRQEYENEMYAADYNFETVNDAIYSRNKAVEDLLKVNLKYSAVTGSNTSYESAGGMRDALINSLSAGPNDCYHIISNYAAKGVILLTQGCYMDFSGLKHLDLSRGWWDSSYIEASSYQDKIYSLVGAANTLATERLHVCFINFDLAAATFPDADFYQQVFDEEWNYERLLETIEQVGDAEANGGTYGLALGYNSTSADGFLIALGVNIVEKNAQGVPTVVMASERNDTIVEALKTLYNDNPATISDYDTSKTGSTYGGRKAFEEGKSLFYMSIFSYAKTRLANVGFKYGIMPMPMWEDEGYRTTPQNEYSCFSIMRNLPEDMYEAVGATLEALAYESYEYVYPALFEEAYQYRYSGDNPRAAQMYDLLVESRVYDFGYIYSNAINRPVFVFRDYIVQNQSGLADKIAARNLDKYLSEFLAFYN